MFQIHPFVRVLAMGIEFVVDVLSFLVGVIKGQECVSANLLRNGNTFYRFCWKPPFLEFHFPTWSNLLQSRFLMNRVIQDRLKHDYRVLTRCPFIPKIRVHVSLRKDFESRANSRLDLLQLIDEQWEEVLSHHLPDLG